MKTNESNTTVIFPAATQYVVRLGIHAVLFHTNMHSKRCYEVVKDETATKFSSISEAQVMAADWKLQSGSYSVKPLDLTNNQGNK